MKPYPSINYFDYLEVQKLISLQKPKSTEYGRPAHDEMLFIITHQTYELWFKQILTELDAVLKTFAHDSIGETEMGTAVARLERITEIQKLLIQQVSVLETMTPLDFLDFREFLYPASGFQSQQNRLIENRLGLRVSDRLPYNSAPYTAAVTPGERPALATSETQPSLFDLVDRWLARTPFLKGDDFDFWKMYRAAVDKLFSDDAETVRAHATLDTAEKERNLNEIEASAQTFGALFDETRYEGLRTDGHFRLTYPALHAALLIQLYRDQPVLQLPFRLITALQNIDELMTTWRYRHALMAHRMLGRKIGTGGSSGSQYLKAATEKHRIFADFFNLATFFIPRSRLPELPAKIRERLGFHYSV